MSSVEMLVWLKKIESKFMKDEGIVIGAIGVTSGDKIKLKCTEDGKLLVEAVATVSGAVSVDNFPAEYPLPASQVTSLKTVSVDNLPADYPDSEAQTRLGAIRDRIGEVSATPTANTLQDRLRDLQEALGSIATDYLRVQTV